MAFPDPLLIVALVAAGALSGLFAGLLGVGGGLVNVPVLTFVLRRLGLDVDLAVQVAVGTSLGTIVFTSVSSAGTYARNGLLDWRQSLAMAPSGVVASMLISLLAINLEGSLVGRLFGVLGLVMAWRMARRPSERGFRLRLGRGGFVLTGVLAGAVSSMFGVGGGLIAVPLQVLGLDIKPHQANANSSVLVALLALVGVSVRLFARQSLLLPSGCVGLVYLPGVLVMAPLSIVLAWAGARLAVATDAKRLRRIFAALLAAVGISMLFV